MSEVPDLLLKSDGSLKIRSIDELLHQLVTLSLHSCPPFVRFGGYIAFSGTAAQIESVVRGSRPPYPPPHPARAPPLPPRSTAQRDAPYDNSASLSKTNPAPELIDDMRFQDSRIHDTRTRDIPVNDTRPPVAWQTNPTPRPSTSSPVPPSSRMYPPEPRATSEVVWEAESCVRPQEDGARLPAETQSRFSEVAWTGEPPLSMPGGSSGRAGEGGRGLMAYAGGMDRGVAERWSGYGMGAAEAPISSKFGLAPPVPSCHDGRVWPAESASAFESGSRGYRAVARERTGSTDSRDYRAVPDDRTGSAEGRGPGWRSESNERGDGHRRDSVQGSMRSDSSMFAQARTRGMSSLPGGMTVDTMGGVGARPSVPSDWTDQRGQSSTPTLLQRRGVQQKQQQQQQQNQRYHRQQQPEEYGSVPVSSRSVNSVRDSRNEDQATSVFRSYGSRSEGSSGGGPHTAGESTGGGVRSSGDSGMFHHDGVRDARHHTEALSRDESVGSDHSGRDGAGTWPPDAKRQRRTSSPMFVSAGAGPPGSASKPCNLEDDDTAPCLRNVPNAGGNVPQVPSVPHTLPPPFQRNDCGSASSVDEVRGGGSGWGDYREQRGDRGRVDEIDGRGHPSQGTRFLQHSGSQSGPFVGGAPELVPQRYTRRESVDVDTSASRRPACGGNEEGGSGVHGFGRMVREQPVTDEGKYDDRAGWRTEAGWRGEGAVVWPSQEQPRRSFQNGACGQRIAEPGCGGGRSSRTGSSSHIYQGTYC